MKTKLIILACALIAGVTARAGHYLNDSIGGLYVGDVTIGYNVTGMPAFNAVYQQFDVVLNGASGSKLRVCNLKYTQVPNGAINHNGHVDRAKSNNLGAWLAGDCSMQNIAPSFISNHNNSFFVSNYQPGLNWWADILGGFHQGRNNEVDCNLIIFCDSSGNPLAAFNPVTWTGSHPSSVVDWIYGHRFSANPPHQYSNTTRVTVLGQMPANSFPTLWKK